MADGAGASGREEPAQREYVKLISAEGFEFVIHREAAMVSKTLKGMLQSSGTFQETDTGELHFPEIRTPILEKLCQYFYFNLRYSNPANAKNVPEFKIEPEIVLHLLMAADYLDT